ncbi:winged helix-turn-helix transcriptional regulator [Actinokineospora globicatena]|uniref:winged helix-turn-helix transcriptional regulator n=1 Tax=Actinokineospora globicatena TaxID=103729 RepID=UPI0020A24C5C|nr:winged helix-turn-helix transcriptional regulator [Actinokineospora globicatena]GLW75693.1 HxlR family transcriptional regulator [Actinokineospora globicatena]GLW82534.1 HxlR family transcriptional regulator [Actinokineospora globicatena]
MMHPPDRPSALGAGGDNAIAYAIGTVADEWTLLILRHALRDGTSRPADWQRLLPISNAVLLSRLRHLSDVGVLVPVGDRSGRREFQLSPRGAALWPFLLCVGAWELTWAGGARPDLTEMRHTGCGAVFTPVLVCRTCGVSVAPREVAAEFGPSGSWPRSTPTATSRRRSSGSTSLGGGFFPESRAVVGNRWSAIMLAAAYLGARRFPDFQRRLGVPATVVADRLRTFSELGVLVPTGDPDRATRSSYHLTDKGRALFAAVVTGLEWGQRWFQAPEGPAVLLDHGGHRFEAVLVCSTCDEALAGRSIETVPAR